ncbi:MAG TPA: response regulator [bacterium]|nr:response regulator [bacterium]
MNSCAAECGTRTAPGSDGNAVARGLVLVVDDNEVNRELYRETLLTEGFSVLTADDGIRGLESAIRNVPDVILLDVMMPGMDGFKVCSKLKNTAATRDIPVIFITAKVETRDIVQGLKLGGVDYLTKPVKLTELIARVKTQMRIRSLEKERLLAEQARLEAAHWEAIKSMSEGLAHNFNNILAAVLGNVQFIQKTLTDEILKEAAADCLDSLEKAKRLVRLLLIYFDLRPDMAKADVLKVIEEQAAPVRAKLTPKIELAVEVEAPAPELAPGSSTYLKQALEAVIENAREAVKQGPGKITIRAYAEKNVPDHARLVIEVSDTGPGVSDEVKAKAFLPFFSTKNTVGVGLGLYAAKMALAQIKGAIELDNRPEGGAVARIFLPLSGGTDT